MPEELVLELETADSVEGCLENIEDILRGLLGLVGEMAERQKGAALAFENAWRQIITNVAKGQTAEMQEARPRLLSDFEKRLGLLKRSHGLLTSLSKRGRADLDADFLLSEIADMERLKDRVFDRWQSAEDLEDLAARDYPLTTADLDQIGPHRRAPASWYAEEGKPF